MKPLRLVAIPVLLALGGVGLAFAGLAITLSAGEHAVLRNYHASAVSYFGSLVSLLSLGWFGAIRLDGPRPKVAVGIGALTAAAGLAFALLPFVQSYARGNTFEATAWRGVSTGFALVTFGWLLFSRPLRGGSAALAGTALGLTAFAFGLTGIVELFASHDVSEAHGYDWLALGFLLAILASAARAGAPPATES